MINIVYASFHCSESMFERLFRDSDHKPGQAIQKYNRLLAEGLAQQSGVRVYSICELPITEENYHKKFFHRMNETIHDVRYYYISLVNIHRLKDILAVISAFWACAKICCKKDAMVISDILNAPVALGAFLAARLCKKKYVAIVTDAPQFVYFDSDVFYHKVSDFLIKYASGYVLLTEQMNDLYNDKKKPYVVIEGLVDIQNQERTDIEFTEIPRTKICMYTGSIHEKYGIGNLVQGFIQSQIENVELHIYGDGDYREKLEEICKTHPVIKYFGNIMSSEIINRQKEATLLINPRPTTDEFTKYSFPSKNMEYMVSGVPVLTTKLPGMPKEYYEYVFLLPDESSEGISQQLKKLFAEDAENLYEMGSRARDYVLNNKNNIMQAGKVLSLYM